MTISNLRKKYPSAEFYFFRNGKEITNRIYSTDKVKSFEVRTTSPDKLNESKIKTEYVTIEM